MILEYLSEDITPETLANEVRGLEIDIPEESDYDPSMWPEMKSKSFISTYEKIKGRDGLWQLSFNNGRLYLVQFNIEFGSKSENAYNSCMDICRSIFKINNSIRGMKDQLTASESKSYLELKSEGLSAKGIPDGITIQFACYRWRNEIITASLSAVITWPDSMSVEYREELINQKTCSS